MLAKPVSRPWRRFLRFSVRGMIVLVLVTGGWLGWVVRSARIQREAVAAIEKAGGSVDYDWEWTDGDYIQGKRARWQEWLGDRVGFEYASSVSRVILLECDSQPVFSQLRNFDRLEALYLGGPVMTDDRLVHLERLASLRELRVDTIGDGGLARIGSLRGLQRLYLFGPKVTDNGLAHLRGLPSLELLWLSNTRVTRVGMFNLRMALPKLMISIK